MVMVTDPTPTDQAITSPSNRPSEGDSHPPRERTGSTGFSEGRTKKNGKPVRAAEYWLDKSDWEASFL